MARKTDKICLVCGKTFQGTAAAMVCGNACRTALHRMLKNGKKPEYWIVAKSKGQRMPLWFPAPNPKWKESKEVPLNSEIKYTETTKESFDGAKVDRFIQDEIGVFGTVPELTKEQKAAKRAEIEKKIREETNRLCPIGAHPKRFQLERESKIYDLEQELKLYN